MFTQSACLDPPNLLRSVMPLDVLGCTRATLMRSTSLQSCLKWPGNLFKMHRDGVVSLGGPEPPKESPCQKHTIGALCKKYQYYFGGVSYYPRGPCTQIMYTLGPMYLHREYFKANVYTV